MYTHYICRYICQRVFDVTFRENRPRLQRKFHARMHQETQVQRTTEEENEGETAAPKQKKINNLSSLELGEASLKLLSKGPNFALTQKITESVILEAEKRVERLAYAKRWKDSMKRFRLQALAAAGNGDAITVSVPSRPASTNTDTGRVDTTRVDTESSVLGVTQQLPGKQSNTSRGDSPQWNVRILWADDRGDRDRRSLSFDLRLICHWVCNAGIFMSLHSRV